MSRPVKTNLEPHSDEIKDMRLQGKGAKEIAWSLNKKYPDLNANRDHINHHLKKLGLSVKPKSETEPEQTSTKSQTKVKIRRKQVWTPETIKKHDELTKQGIDTDSIATRLGVSKSAVNLFRSRTGRTKRPEEITPDIEQKIKAIRKQKYKYTTPYTKNPKEVYPGEKHIQQQIFSQTGKQVGQFTIRKLLGLRTGKGTPKMKSTITEGRIKNIVSKLAKKRKATPEDKITHAETAYKRLNLHLQDLKRTFAGEAHPEVQSLIDRQMEHTNDVLNSLNKIATRAREKKKRKVGFFE